MAFTHIVTFKWRTDDVDAAAVSEALRRVIARSQGVGDYMCGADAGFTPGAYDFAVVGTFDDEESFTAYRDDPEHRRIISEMITPHLADRTVVQLRH